jgi:hypothetical protein
MWPGTKIREAIVSVSAGNPHLQAIIALLDARDVYRIAWEAYRDGAGAHGVSPLDEINACAYLLYQAEESYRGADDESQRRATALARDAIDHAKAALRAIDDLAMKRLRPTERAHRLPSE